METGDYIEKRLEESQVIDLIIEKSNCTYGNLDFFWEVTNVPRTNELNFDKYYIAKEILRTELGFEKDQKPGDIDILIVPSSKGRIFFEYSSAYELKVVRPTNDNIRRNSNSLGSTQTLGLVNDGFPLIGLIQVCMNQPINPIHLQYLPNLENINEIFTFDPFPLFSVETQYQRILKTDLPKYVGINIFGLCFDINGNIITQNSTKFDSFKHGYCNPYCKNDTIERIKIHFEKFKGKYIEKVNK
ncbi:hypothetical protein [Salmonirosea aquatica]|uniref:Uncharacterized protein n=1 Tax=Salmonirosea aquatica TaxID=2654236 RepID=A0A7C9BKH3_9BACT|nr:hypothetical protein [Cytophagaceae bacterium SJW1-29]